MELNSAALGGGIEGRLPTDAARRKNLTEASGGVIIGGYIRLLRRQERLSKVDNRRVGKATITGAEVEQPEVGSEKPL